MSLWRRKALDIFPNLRRAIAEAESAGWAWFALRQALAEAYGQNPRDESFVAAVYDYASWCLRHRSVTVRTAVLFWFYEGLAVDALLRPDMARWVSQGDFDVLEPTWAYVLSEENLTAFRDEFTSQKASALGIASRRQRSIVRKTERAGQ